MIDGDYVCRGGNTDYELYVGFISPPAANAKILRNAGTQVLYDDSKKGKKLTLILMLQVMSCCDNPALPPS